MKTEHLAVSVLTLAVQGALAAMLALPVAAAADDEPDIASLTRPTNNVEVGAENVSQSSAKFGEYNGLDKSGGYLIGNFKVRGGDAYNAYDGGQGVTRWEIKGTDLGTDSREVSGSVSNQGQWSIGVGYDQLRHHITDSYQTPYQGGMGGNGFSLPASFGGIDISAGGTQNLTAGQQAALQTQRVFTDRKNTSFSAGYIFDRQWSIQFDYNHLSQTGAKLMAASVDATGAVGAAGENSVTLMNPTNYKTDTFELAVDWAGDKGHFTGSYFASIFKDGYDSVSWSNPYWDSTVGGAVSPPPYPTNVYATPPNNSFHQLNLAGGYEFTEATKLAGGFSYGRNTQNSSFINDPLLTSALPQASLSGLVVTTHADLKLTNQTTKDLVLAAGLKYDERDNRTPSNVYASFASIAGDPWGPTVNAPVSNRKTQLEFAGSYRIDKRQNVRLAYEYEQVKRWCNNSLANGFQSADVLGNPLTAAYYTTSACVQVPESKENKLSASYKLKVMDGVNFNAGYSYARRRSDINSSYYNPMQTSSEGLQNFGYVGYFDASRTEQLVKAGVNWRATEKLTLGLTGRYLDDDYDSTLGLQKGHTWGMNLDAAYGYSPGGTASAYLSVQRRQRDLSSSADKNPLATVGADTLWSNRLTDDSNTLGLTLKQKGLLGGRLEMNGDLSYSLGKTTYSTDASSCTNALCGDPTVNSGSLPTIRNEMWRLKLTGIYQLDKASKIGVGYVYKKLKSDDYYYSAYQLNYTDPTVLPTNQQAPNYSVNLFKVSYIYSFQ